MLARRDADVPEDEMVIGDVSTELAAVIASSLASVLGAAYASLRSWRATAKQEKAERARLYKEIFGALPPLGVDSGSMDALLAIARPTEGDSVPGDSPVQEPVAPTREQMYDKLLIDDYALGMTQARVAFNVSMAFSILGGIVLVVGIGLAVFRADTSGQIASAAVTSLAGALTTGLSQLFRDQSAKALKHLESQAIELRKDVREQTKTAEALRLLGEVDDPEVRSHLQTALILQFTGAKLPDQAKPRVARSTSSNGHGHKPGDVSSTS